MQSEKACDELLSISKAAAAVGVNKSTICRQVKSGQIRSHNGLIRLSELIEDRKNHVDRSRSRRRSGSIDEVASQDMQPDDTATRNDRQIDHSTSPYAVARTRKEDAAASLRQLDFDLKSGRVVPIDVVIAGIVEQSARIRNKLLSLPTRVAPRAAVLRSSEEVRALVEREVALILQELTLDGHGHVSIDDLRDVLRERFGTVH